MTKYLHYHGYRQQLIQQIEETDYLKRFNFSVEMLDQVDNDPYFLKRIVFSDEAIFHVSGCVNRHNSIIWAKENPHAFIE